MLTGYVSKSLWLSTEKCFKSHSLLVMQFRRLVFQWCVTNRLPVSSFRYDRLALIEFRTRKSYSWRPGASVLWEEQEPSVLWEEHPHPFWVFEQPQALELRQQKADCLGGPFAASASEWPKSCRIQYVYSEVHLDSVVHGGKPSWATAQTPKQSGFKPRQNMGLWRRKLVMSDSNEKNEALKSLCVAWIHCVTICSHPTSTSNLVFLSIRAFFGVVCPFHLIVCQKMSKIMYACIYACCIQTS